MRKSRENCISTDTEEWNPRLWTFFNPRATLLKYGHVDPSSSLLQIKKHNCQSPQISRKWARNCYCHSKINPPLNVMQGEDKDHSVYFHKWPSGGEILINWNHPLRSFPTVDVDFHDIWCIFQKNICNLKIISIILVFTSPWGIKNKEMTVFPKFLRYWLNLPNISEEMIFTS